MASVFLWVALAAFFLPLLGSILLYLLWLYEEKNAPAANRKMPGNFVALAVCLLESWFSFIGIYCLYCLRFLVRNMSPQPYTGGCSQPLSCPLIFVHPAMQNAGSWLLYHYFFRKAGYSRLYYFEYNCCSEDFAAAVKRLHKFIEQVTASNACNGATPSCGSKPVLIGASLGGLLVRGVLGQGAGKSLRGVITLGCPHKGTRLAAFAPPRLGGFLRKITYNGELVQKLDQHCVEPCPSLYAFYSLYDEMVLPRESLLPPSGWEHEKIGAISHISMMLHIPTIRRVIEKVGEFSGTAF